MTSFSFNALNPVIVPQTWIAPSGLDAIPLSPSAVLFVDAGIADSDRLIAGVTSETAVYRLDGAVDAIAQITQVLSGMQNVASVQIVAHGKSGGLQLGATWLDAQSLSTYASQLQSWQSALSPTADILLYGCNVAEGAAGREFIDRLAQVTGADIAASDDLTGNSALGGDWDLEIATGAIEGRSSLLPEVQQRYQGVLAPSYTENAAPVLLDPAATVTSNNLNNGTLTVRYTAGGTVDDRLAIRNEGTSSTQINLDGRNIFYGNTQIASFTGGIGTENLVITFKANATAESAQALLRNITYSNVSDNPSTADRTIEIRLIDGSGASTTKSATLDLSATNDSLFLQGTTNLYEPRPNASIDSNGWLQLRFANGSSDPTEVFNATGTTLTTSADNYAGYSNYATTKSVVLGQTILTFNGNKLNPNFPVLDATQGYVLSFTSKLLEEQHANSDRNNDQKDDRAGFSVVLNGENLKGIELGFWKDRIFAQEDAATQVNKGKQPEVASSNDDHLTFFTQAEFANYNTTIETQYDLVVQGDFYTLYATQNPLQAKTAILRGKLRDYSTFTPPTVPGISADKINPYNKKSFVFLGDNTSDASASVLLTNIGISTATSTSLNVFENQAGKVITALKAIDLDGTPTLTLNQNPGNQFEIDPKNQLKLKTGEFLNFEAIPNGTLTVGVTATSGNDVVQQAFTIKVLDVSETPNPQADLLLRNSASGEVAIWGLDRTQIATARYAQLTDGTVIKPDANWRIVSGQSDFNNDGVRDLVWFNSATTETAIWYMQLGAEGIANIISSKSSSVYLPLAQQSIKPGGQWQLTAVADLLGDSRPEFLWEDRASGISAIWQLDIASSGRVDINLTSSGYITFNDAAKTPIATGGIAAGWKIIGVGNFDGDLTTKDLLLFNERSAETVIWQLNGTVFAGGDYIKNNGVKIQPVGWQPVAIGNIDGTGIDEILWQNGTAVATWALGANFTLTSKSALLSQSLLPGEQIQGLGDFDLNRSLDLVVRRKFGGSDTTQVYHMDANNFQLSTPRSTSYVTGPEQTIPLVTGDPRWDVAVVADLGGLIVI